MREFTPWTTDAEASTARLVAGIGHAFEPELRSITVQHNLAHLESLPGRLLADAQRLRDEGIFLSTGHAEEATNRVIVELYPFSQEAADRLVQEYGDALHVVKGRPIVTTGSDPQRGQAPRRTVQLDRLACTKARSPSRSRAFSTSAAVAHPRCAVATP